MRNIMLCDGNCGEFHYEINLLETCYKQMLCDGCMSDFISGQERVEDGRN